MRILLTTLHSRYVHASLALPYLAAYCAAPGRSIIIREFNINQPKENLLAQIVACEADVVCFSVYLWNRITTLELVLCLKQINPQLRIVLGGPEISFEDKGFFDRYPVDAVVCGEGEVPLQHLLKAWGADSEPEPIAGLKTPSFPDTQLPGLLVPLDQIPSPFALDLVDLSRGLVYYESSRGCPYQCSFCLSSVTSGVRSFSMERIKADLDLLIQNRVKMIKFVDRTFNFSSERTRDIFNYILNNNHSSSFHFEMGAHLLDDATIDLLKQVPSGMFQFEIGVQSTLPETLENVSRQMSLERLAKNVSLLRCHTRTHLHLDLVAGLPGESFRKFMESVDWTYALGADHLQIELVKLLPGTPLRHHAEALGICYDVAPPYTILRSNDISYRELERIRGMGRLNDLLINSHKFPRLVARLVEAFGRLSALLLDMDQYWNQQQLYLSNRSLRDLAHELDTYLHARFEGDRVKMLRECLSRDYAHCERVVSGSAPAFFNTELTEAEQQMVSERVKSELVGLQRSGKVQYFSAVYYHLSSASKRNISLFLYIRNTGDGLLVRELVL